VGLVTTIVCFQTKTIVHHPVCFLKTVKLKVALLAVKLHFSVKLDVQLTYQEDETELTTRHYYSIKNVWANNAPGSDLTCHYVDVRHVSK